MLICFSSAPASSLEDSFAQLQEEAEQERGRRMPKLTLQPVKHLFGRQRLLMAQTHERYLMANISWPLQKKRFFFFICMLYLFLFFFLEFLSQTGHLQHGTRLEQEVSYPFQRSSLSLCNWVHFRMLIITDVTGEKRA